MGQPSETVADTDERVYYVISDLHIGGNEELEHVEFHDELLDFLEQRETTDENAELIIKGDTFGLWEITPIEGDRRNSRSIISSRGQYRKERIGARSAVLCGTGAATCDRQSRRIATPGSSLECRAKT